MKIKCLKSYWWRKERVLSATFLLLVFSSIIFLGCRKKENQVGLSALSQEDILLSDGVDTFSLHTFSVIEDSVSSANPRFNIVGAMNDPVFGISEASFYTQLSLSGFSPDFGDLNTVTIDSFVLALRYGGYYGTLEEHLFEVYELDEDLSADSNYYAFSSSLVKPINLVPTSNNEGLILPKPITQTIVGEDTVSPQLRIPLDTTFARSLMELAEIATDNEEFISSFKGLQVKVNNGILNAGKGSMLYFESTNPASKLTVYYKKDTVPQSFDFLISADLLDYNHLIIDNSGTQVSNVLADTISGQMEFYTQAFRSRAKITFPTLDNLPRNIVIHKASLELPVSYYVGSNFYPSTIVTAAAKFEQGNDDYFLIDGDIQYNQQLKSYVIDMRAYLQTVINGEAINDGIVLSPLFFNTSTERIVLNGPNSTNKLKPKLSILYTEF